MLFERIVGQTMEPTTNKAQSITNVHQHELNLEHCEKDGQDTANREKIVKCNEITCTNHEQISTVSSVSSETVPSFEFVGLDDLPSDRASDPSTDQATAELVTEVIAKLKNAFKYQHWKNYDCFLNANQIEVSVKQSKCMAIYTCICKKKYKMPRVGDNQWRTYNLITHIGKYHTDVVVPKA